MFPNFDFSVLENPDFKEDAVREEIIAPIIRKLGYRPTGQYQVQRSKTIIHPFVMIGSKKHEINIVPDYTLIVNNKAAAILEAKRPQEQIVKSKHVEQAYSYAIHPDIQAKHYALCNGKDFVVYNITKWEPLLNVPVQEIDNHWEDVEKALGPKYLENPDLREFFPDYGLTMRRLGCRKETKQIFIDHYLQTLSRVNDDLYTAGTTTIVGEIEYFVSFDFSKKLLDEMLSQLPSEISDAISSKLSYAPFSIELECKVVLSCAGYLGELTKGAYEDFVPFLVSEITSVRYDPTIEPNT